MQVSIPIFDLVRLLSVAQCSMYLTCFVAQTHRNDIECLAYTLIDCLRDLPWRRITGGTDKQFEDRVREKKGSWTSERLCVGLTGSSQTFLALVRGGRGEEPDYKCISEAFESDNKQGGYIKGLPIVLPESGNPQGIVLHNYLRTSRLTNSVPLDYAPPLDQSCQMLQRQLRIPLISQA